MKIDPAEIPSEGLEVRESCEPGPMALEQDDVKFCSPLALDCKFRKAGSDVFCAGSFAALVKLTCARCANEFTNDLRGKFSFEFPGKGNETTLDLTDDIRQEVLLGYPLKSLCRSDCKGLCPVCGQNLNEGDCGHKAKPIDHSLSKLKDWMKKKNGSTKEKTL